MRTTKKYTKKTGGEMKQIMENKNDELGWNAISASYSGLSKDAAKEEVKTLRRYAKENESGYLYKIRDVSLVPK